MAKIKVTSKCEIYDGMSITFKAPCASNAVDGLKVYYNGSSKTFSFRDAHGNNISGASSLFSSGAYIKAVLNTANNLAYIQNADSNGYLDGKITTLTQAAAAAQSTADTALATATAAARIATGSYTGNGAYGFSNKNTLTFDFVPKFVVVLGDFNNASLSYRLFLINGAKYASAGYAGGNPVTVSWDDTTVSWYCSNYTAGADQMNLKDATYRYVAIG